ncbi:MAG TPA: sugar ABC transporter ATP-binding protein, partial [Acidimicrobiia bacterium]|nr:sugar ABC transporter ATP-binding protein [Acidimicrobiia bacterium]
MAKAIQPLIELLGVTKAYPGVIALQDLDLAIIPGRVHGVVGLNGAGKSTLVKVLAGTISPDSGSISARERPGDGRLVNMVPQDIVVVPQLSIGRNILLGREPGFPVRRRLNSREERFVRSALGRVGLDIDPESLPSACSPQELRLVQIAKAMADPADVLLLDEPTAVLAEGDASRLLKTLSTLRDAGEAIVYISHRLGEVLQIADEITVLRDGRKVASFTTGEVGRKDLLDLLTKHGTSGNTGTFEAPERGGVVLEVEGLVGLGFRDVNLQVRAGEIIALVGVQGAGQSAVVQALAGLRPTASGSVRLGGRSVTISSPSASTRAGLMLVPADRRARGVVAAMDTVENIALSPRSSAKRGGFRKRRAERDVASRYVNRFGIKTPRLATHLATLSGGNQQKVVLSRAIEARPEVLLLDEPTQGIDVATKWEILARIKSEAREIGFPVLAASSELE